jgi:hypothetical protein
MRQRGASYERVMLLSPVAINHLGHTRPHVRSPLTY